MFKKTAFVLLCCASTLALAQTPANVTEKSLSNVFSQQVFYNIPSNFNNQLLSERANDTNYIHERGLRGETAQNWSQVITVTGIKGLAANKDVTPMILIGTIVLDFQKICPTSFAGTKFLDGTIGNGTPVAAAVLSCGTAKDKSETTLVTAIKGSNDYYTVQWAERGKASKKPLKIDEQKWIERLNLLAPGIQNPPNQAPAKKAKR